MTKAASKTITANRKLGSPPLKPPGRGGSLSRPTGQRLR